jgi:hypothetical protein
MKIYNALIKKNKEGKIEDLILLKEGFSFFAFLFSGLWFLYHKMWKEMLAVVLINIVFVKLADFSVSFDDIFLQVALIFMIALNANYWFCQHLISKGYQFSGMSFGANCDEARLNFVKNFSDDLELSAQNNFTSKKA